MLGERRGESTLDYDVGQAGGGSTVMLRNGAEEALFGAKPQTKVLNGREGGWKRRMRLKKKIVEEKKDEEGCQRDGDDELKVIARTMKRFELTGEMGQLVRYKRHEHRALSVRCEERERERERSRPSLRRKPVVLRETSSLATTYFSSLGSGACLEREEERAL